MNSELAELFTNIANSLRKKLNSSNYYVPTTFANLIDYIPTYGAKGIYGIIQEPISSMNMPIIFTSSIEKTKIITNSPVVFTATIEEKDDDTNIT